MRALSDIVCNQYPLVMKPTDTVRAACEAMRDRHVGSVLIVGADGNLAGIFTGRDAVWRVLAAGRSAARTALAKVMTPSPVTMTAKQTAIDALRLMWDGGFRHLPVIDEGKIVGVVSRGDFKGEEALRLDDERDLWEHMR
ncbi:MAG TPA: CBS domain-containing protein [Caulobacterales bacterium]|jgi:CBS domain-containing protein|nr:CBS domain-containing protein [Caulobacterales bacterium]